jgi:ABC-type siderophore export system fused ATPase/permease subunit
MEGLTSAKTQLKPLEEFKDKVSYGAIVLWGVVVCSDLVLHCHWENTQFVFLFCNIVLFLYLSFFPRATFWYRSLSASHPIYTFSFVAFHKIAHVGGGQGELLCCRDVRCCFLILFASFLILVHTFVFV